MFFFEQKCPHHDLYVDMHVKVIVVRTDVKQLIAITRRIHPANSLFNLLKEIHYTF